MLRTSYGASKKENFCLPRSILSEAKDCYGARLLSAPKERLGWEAARPGAVPRSELCSTTGVSKEAKPAKIDSLIEKIFCACPLKNVSIFTGFVRRPRRSRSATLRGRQAASRWAGLPPAGRQLVGVLPEMSSDFF